MINIVQNNNLIQRLHRRGLTPSEWTTNLSNKTQKKKLKTQNPMNHNQIYRVHI
jgi:hypothetical protein